MAPRLVNVPPLRRGLRVPLSAGILVALLSVGLVRAPVAASAAGSPTRMGRIDAAHPLLLPHVVDTRPGLVQEIQAPRRSGTGPAEPPPAAIPLRTGASAAPELLQAWGGTSLSAQTSALGADQDVTPPDPQIAVGSSWVVETTNSSLSVRQRNGAAFPDRPGATCPPPGPLATGYVPVTLGGCNQIDLNNFIDANGWILSDPRVLYDSGAGRFYLSFFLTTSPGPTSACLPGYPPGATCSVVFVLHTVTGDPTGAWSGFYFDSYYLNAITDEPMIGFSSDKIGVSWDEFDAKGLNWEGDEYFVMSKSAFLAQGSKPIIYPTSGQLGVPTLQYFSIFPVSNPWGGATLYLINNSASTFLPGTGGPAVVIMAVTGNTASGVHVATSAVPIETSSPPPAAPQAGSVDTIDTDDDRISNGVWAGGVLWTGFDEACTVSTATLACIRYIAIDTATSPPSVSIDDNYGIPATYVYYPSFGIDPSGDLMSTFTASSPSSDPGVMAVGVTTGSTQISGAVSVVSGAGPYVSALSGACSVTNDPSGQTAACRWGDFAAAAVDPRHPDDIWFVNEAQLDGSVATDWGTEVGRLTYAKPSIANLTPAVGPTAGGTTVVVNGSDFGPGTTFSFAGAAQAISNLTPDSFTFSTPAHAAGSVTGAAGDGLGTSASAPYLYVEPSRYVPLPPYRILDTRAGSCVQSCGALGAGQTRTIQVGGYVPPGYTGTTVPASATAVVLNLTAVQGTAGTYLTVFPAGGGVPTASNLNAGAGEILPTLVTAALGSSGANPGYLSIYNALGSIQVLADVEGYYTSSTGTSGEYHALPAPARACDTRSGNATSCSGSSIGAGQSLLVAVTGGSSGVTDGGNAAAVALNLTAVQGTAGTYLTVYPPASSGGSAPSCASRPLASNLNVAALAIQPNRVAAQVTQYQGAGYVCVFNAAGTINVILDVDGWFGDGSDSGGHLFYALGPTRICDTRYTSGTECAGRTIGAAAALAVQVSGVGPLPASGLAAVVANVTAVQGTSGTYLSVYPDAGSPPATSDLNAAAGEIIANLALVGVAADGKIDVYNAAGSINVIIDVAGWFA